MTKVEEQLNPLSCWNKAHDFESLFILLARDAAAPATIAFWINERIKLGLNQEGDPQLLEAAERAMTMRHEYEARQQALKRATTPKPQE